jgi:hypothetical protein
MALWSAQQFSADANVIAFRIRFGAQLRNRVPVYGDQSTSDQLFGLAPGCDSGSSDDFLQAFSGHNSDYQSVIVILSEAKDLCIPVQTLDSLRRPWRQGEASRSWIVFSCNMQGSWDCLVLS